MKVGRTVELSKGWTHRGQSPLEDILVPQVVMDQDCISAYGSSQARQFLRPQFPEALD
jgi:hypothetical protein